MIVSGIALPGMGFAIRLLVKKCIMEKTEKNNSLDLDPKTKIEDLNLSARTVNSLVNAGIKTIAGLKRMSDLKLSEVKGLGKKGFDEIKVMLEK